MSSMYQDLCKTGINFDAIRLNIEDSVINDPDNPLVEDALALVGELENALESSECDYRYMQWLDDRNSRLQRQLSRHGIEPEKEVPFNV